MKLRILLQDVEQAEVDGDPELEISGLAYDSRRVAPGFLFVAMRGEKTDGNLYVADAVARGAAAVLSEERVRSDTDIVSVWTPDARTALARIAKRWYGAPDEELTMVGVTGTNGKTTVAHILQTILDRCCGPAGRIGTITYYTGSRELPAPLTTPEALEIQGMLREMSGNGCSSAVLEASSHAVDRKRLMGLDFNAVVFTNLSRDHLDYHGDMESYYLCKRRLFLRENFPRAKAIINIDDSWGKRLARETDMTKITFGTTNEADVKAVEVAGGMKGLSLIVRALNEEFMVGSRLIGSPNVENILAAVAAAWALGLSGYKIAGAVAEVPTVRGRLELVPTGKPFDVMIDYAHTDDALRRLLLTARELKRGGGRVIVVFGCGGDRDRGKRPVMGRRAVELADVAILTSDNPRSEDPLAIIAEVEKGISEVEKPRASFQRLPDRREAIGAALAMARSGDLVVIAGKGHEDHQIIGDRKLHFDDREEALKALMEL